VECGNVFGLAVAVERCQVLRHLGEEAVLRVHIGVDGTRLDHIDGDAARTIREGAPKFSSIWHRIA
jgi:hypothetical protein